MGARGGELEPLFGTAIVAHMQADKWAKKPVYRGKEADVQRNAETRDQMKRKEEDLF